jgi:hypothetical protein
LPPNVFAKCFYLKSESTFERYADDATKEYFEHEEERKKKEEESRLKNEKRDAEKRNRI